MSIQFEFLTDVGEGTLTIPAEILGRLRNKGISRVRVVVAAAGEEEALAGRGISEESVVRIAERQRYDRDVAATALACEGMAGSSAPLSARLRALLHPQPESE